MSERKFGTRSRKSGAAINHNIKCTDMLENTLARLPRPSKRDSRNLAHVFSCISVYLHPTELSPLASSAHGAELAPTFGSADRGFSISSLSACSLLACSSLPYPFPSNLFLILFLPTFGESTQHFRSDLKHSSIWRSYWTRPRLLWCF